jgi:aminobenzoyl-glutamate utilization protein B
VLVTLWLSAPLARGAQSDPAAGHREWLLTEIDGRQKQVQVINDMLFSFSELGFQEFETTRYLTELLEKEGFRVQRGVAGMPTAWVATWGSGKPVIALGSDIDCIPQASQKPGVAYHDPLIEGAPGHGEGHNSGQAVNIIAALAVKRLMERERLPGTLLLWPGVAEELLAGKAFLVREGVFKDVDVCLFTHVGNNMNVSWGVTSATSLVSVEYLFQGEAAHSAGAPWRARSALDAVELMNVGWNFRREHLRPQHRSHYVITGGGDQPNVVPPKASVWYYFREQDYERVKGLREIGDRIARGASLMTDTTVTSRILGAAWPQHFNKVIAETMYGNIRRVGLPRWDENDQALAKAVQRELGVPERGLAMELAELEGRVEESSRTGGGSDDIGDISWIVPTVRLRYPSNIPNLPGHHWSNAIAMATPIAHKGAVAGAKVMALTILDLLVRPELVPQAWSYFRDVQTKETRYTPYIGPEDRPATWLNQKTMDTYREQLRKYYYDPSRYGTYLEQLGIRYPTLRTVPAEKPAR